MNFEELTIQDAKNEFEKFEEHQEVSVAADLSKEYREIRTKIINACKYDVLNSKSNLAKYNFDLELALAVYEIFNYLDDNFAETIASNIDFWRYICIKVVPDVVYNRHGLRKEYYYTKWNRMYIPVLWWYIHLTYQGSINKTRLCLMGLNTDYIMQIVDRTSGMDIRFPRAFIKQISELPPIVLKEKVANVALFRKLLMMDKARTNTINMMVENRQEEYIKLLLKDCGITEID